jgi:5-methylcytosine-specific restriction endonuclease McrA
MCEFYEHTCLACGSRGGMTRDHIVPLSRGGSNNFTNLQPLCEPCNKEKGSEATDYRDSYLHTELLAAIRLERFYGP